MSRDIHVRRLVGLLEALQHKKQLHNPEVRGLCRALFDYYRKFGFLL